MNWLRLRPRKTQSLPTTPTKYPVGTFVETEKGYFFIATESKRYRIISLRALQSWSPHRVVKTTEAAVENYRVAAKLRFRNGSLIHNLSDGKIYLIENGLRRHVVSPDALNSIGAHYNEAVTVSQDEIKLHELGEDLA